MKNENRGGARPGAGRKPISAGGEKVDKKIRATITIRPSDHARIKAAAASCEISFSEFLVRSANETILKTAISERLKRTVDVKRKR